VSRLGGAERALKVFNGGYWKSFQPGGAG